MALMNIIIHVLILTVLYNLKGFINARSLPEESFSDSIALLSNSTNNFALLSNSTKSRLNNGTNLIFYRKTGLSKTPRLTYTKVEDYESRRASVIEQEELKATGGNLKLSADEEKADDIFMNYKLAEMLNGLRDSAHHAPGMHFFHAKQLIEQSKAFKILQIMPKGAVLHLHNSAAVSSQWIINKLTRMPGMLSCNKADGTLVLTFRKDNKVHKCDTPYKSVEEERIRARSVQEFDKKLEQNFNLYTNHPESDYNTIEKVWTKFQNMFATIGDALNYIPAYRAYHRRMLEELYEDKIMYAEVRIHFRPLYGDNGVIKSEVQAIEELIDIVHEFKAKHPNFLGIKVIFATNGKTTINSIKAQFEVFKKWHALYPDFIIGFDIVGQEDNTKITLHAASEVLQNMPKTAKFFFHAGETNWYNSQADLNLLDAILMNSARIGHGYALLKHPVMRKAVQDRKIAIEVSPLSNQILHLVWDLRNHPAGFFLSEDVPMVIANDDPGFWGAKGLSYDMYYAIMSFAPMNAGLKTLKNIVWNSIKYSSLNDKERKMAEKLLTKQWNAFVKDVIQGKVLKK